MVPQPFCVAFAASNHFLRKLTRLLSPYDQSSRFDSRLLLSAKSLMGTPSVSNYRSSDFWNPKFDRSTY
jgi:hypothetical protein